MKTNISFAVFFTMLFVCIGAKVSSQNNYAWSSQKIAFTSSIKLTTELNDESTFIAQSKAMTVTLSPVEGMGGVTNLAGSLDNYVNQFDYESPSTAEEVVEANTKIFGAYVWTKQNGNNILIGLLSDVGYNFFFFCEIKYTEGLEDIALSTLKSIKYGLDVTPQKNYPQTTSQKPNKTEYSDNSKQPEKNVANYSNPVDRIVELVNQLRAQGCKCGDKYMPPVAAVVSNDILTKAATAHSQDMENRNYFAHEAPATAPYGEQVWDRVKYFNYQMRMVGENIAYNHTKTPDSYFDQWKKSPGHCENMMNEGFNEIGYGTSGVYATMVLGTQSASTAKQLLTPVKLGSDSNIKPIMYGRESCGNCTAAKKRFKAEGIDFIFYDVDKDEEKSDEMWSLLGNVQSVTFPVIKVGSKTYPDALEKIDEIVKECKQPAKSETITKPQPKLNQNSQQPPAQPAKVYSKVKVDLYGNPGCVNTENCMKKLKNENITHTLHDTNIEENYNKMKMWEQKIPISIPVVFSGGYKQLDPLTKIESITNDFKSFGHEIEIYGDSNDNTKLLKKKLNDAGVTFKFIDLEQNYKLKYEMIQRCKGSSSYKYPVIVINNGEFIYNDGKLYIDSIIDLVKEKHE